MDTKPWLQSKTIWGGLLAAAAGALKVSRNIDVSDVVVTITNNLDGFIAVIGGVVAIVGRFKARTVIAPKDDTPAVPGARLFILPFFAALAAVAFSGGGCSTTQVAKSPAGAAVITKVSNSVIDKGLNAGATRLDTGNPFLHSLADGLRSVEGQVLTSDDVKKIAANFGDPNNKSKFTTLALDVWNVIQDAALKIGWTAATELAAQTLQSAAVNPAPPSP